MCESKVFVTAPEGERLLLADVTSITAEGDGYQLANLFGEQVHVRGRLVVADLLNHRVVFELLP